MKLTRDTSQYSLPYLQHVDQKSRSISQRAACLSAYTKSGPSDAFSRKIWHGVDSLGVVISLDSSCANCKYVVALSNVLSGEFSSPIPRRGQRIPIRPFRRTGEIIAGIRHEKRHHHFLRGGRPEALPTTPSSWIRSDRTDLERAFRQSQLEYCRIDYLRCDDKAAVSVDHSFIRDYGVLNSKLNIRSSTIFAGSIHSLVAAYSILRLGKCHVERIRSAGTGAPSQYNSLVILKNNFISVPLTTNVSYSNDNNSLIIADSNTFYFPPPPDPTRPGRSVWKSPMALMG